MHNFSVATRGKFEVQNRFISEVQTAVEEYVPLTKLSVMDVKQANLNAGLERQ